MAGEWLADAWAKASEAGKAATVKVYEGAVAAVKAAADAVDHADTSLRGISRQVGRVAVDAGSVGVAQMREVGRSIDQGIGRAKAGIKSALERLGAEFPNTPAADVKAKCSNCVADGDFMVPSADGCKGIPRGNLPADTKVAIVKAKGEAQQSDGSCCRKKSPEHRNKTIFYTNGIKTDAEAHCRTLKRISAITCAKVVGIFNETEGGLTDAMRTADARQFLKDEIRGSKVKTYPGFTPAVDTVRRTMQIELLSGEGFEMLAHSEGGAIASLGTMRAGRDLRAMGESGLVGKAKITSMGSAASLWADGPTYDHYLHVNDTTPTYLGLGDGTAGAGNDADIHRFAGSKKNGFEIDPAKRPYIAASPVANHSIDDSYLEYYNQQTGGCG